MSSSTRTRIIAIAVVIVVGGAAVFFSLGTGSTPSKTSSTLSSATPPAATPLTSLSHSTRTLAVGQAIVLPSLAKGTYSLTTTPKGVVQYALLKASPKDKPIIIALAAGRTNVTLTSPSDHSTFTIVVTKKKS